MPVEYRSSSSAGDAALGTSTLIPVPAGAAAGDIAIAAHVLIEPSTVVTPPGEFHPFFEVVVADTFKVILYWARLAGGESGNWTFSWSGSQWATGQAILYSGGLEVGDPVVKIDFVISGGPNLSDTSLSTIVVPFLAHFVAAEQAGASTPPTDFTEVQDSDSLKISYREPGVAGVHIATGGGGWGASITKVAVLVALAPAATAPIVDVGEDSWAVVGSTFGRLVTEHDMGSPIVARVWTVESGPEEVGLVVGNQAFSTWTPTATGTYVLRYTATNGVGSSYDELTLEVGGMVEGPQNSGMIAPAV